MQIQFLCLEFKSFPLTHRFLEKKKMNMPLTSHLCIDHPRIYFQDLKPGGFLTGLKPKDAASRGCLAAPPS